MQEEQATQFEADVQTNTDTHKEEQSNEEHTEENMDNNAYETASETLALDTNSMEAENTMQNSEAEDYINQETDKPSFQSDNENTCTDSHPDEQFELQDTQTTFQDQQEELNPENEGSEANDSPVKELEENKSDEKDDETVVQENGTSQLQMYNEPNSVSDTHDPNLSPNSQNDNSQSQDENSQSQDDNSHCSQISQNSLGSQQPEEYAAGDLRPSTKIAILDDWEDTDSQQSEHSREVKSEITVHKLIDDDWADEDEDDSKKHCS